ncbi:MAG: adenylate/guanylate cyclase domain-containing protein [Thermodesulfobacteriota bacterium]|nr:adenylate/guanylate cyclase domain-containing protein [Thermodesulfobacteriota bacterium]
MKSPNVYDISFGQVLKRRGVITDKQLNIALKEQREKISKHGKAIRLGKIIVELGYASENEILDVINKEFNLSVTSLNENIKEPIIERRENFFKELPSTRVPIWFQLSISFTALIVLTIFILGYVNLTRQKDQLYQQTVKIGMVSLNYFSSAARIPLLDGDILHLNTLIKDAKAVKGILYAIIVDVNGRIKAHTDQMKIGMPYKEYGVNEKKVQGDVAYFDYFALSGEHIIDIVQPVIFKDKKLGEVHVGVSIDFIEQLIQENKKSIITMTLVSFIIGVLVSMVLGLRFSRPISRLVMATEKIIEGDYEYRVHLKNNDELGTLASAFNKMSKELNKKAIMQDSFGKYIGSDVLDMIMENPENLWLKGFRNEATIIITDIRGFTAYSEVNEPEEVVERLNEYLRITTQVILDYGGYVDKFIGDAVLGVFGVPIYHEDHVERAVRAAFDMQSAFQKASKNGNRLLSSVGIAINTGVVVSGNIGSQFKMEYTVIGDSVNIASRLNAMAGSGEIIISKKAYDLLKNIITVETLPSQKLRGRSEEVEVYKALSIKDMNHATKNK